VSLDLDAQAARYAELERSPEAMRIRQVLCDIVNEAKRAGLVVEVDFVVTPAARAFQFINVRPARWGYTNPKKEA